MTAARATLAALLATGALGCAAPGPPFSALALDARLLAGDLPDDATVVRDVEVRALTHVLLWIPTDGQPRTLESALDEALDRGRGDVLVNATVERVAWYVPLLYGEYGWIVRGDVVALRPPARPSQLAPDAENEPDAYEREDAEEAPALPEPAPHERPAEAPPEP